MNRILKIIIYAIFIILSLELGCAIYRNQRRISIYKQAVQRSKQTNKPLMVIGGPI